MTYLLHIRRDKIKEKQKNMQENIQEITLQSICSKFYIVNIR